MRVADLIPSLHDQFLDDLEIYDELCRRGIIDVPPATPPAREPEEPFVEPSIMYEYMENRTHDELVNGLPVHRCVDCKHFHLLAISKTGNKGFCGDARCDRRYVYKYSYKLCDYYERSTIGEQTTNP